MKTMTCRQLGGACDIEFKANTFEEIAQMSKNHGIEMMNKKEPKHLKAMSDMRVLMQNPDALQAWFKNKRTAFEGLPED